MCHGSRLEREKRLVSRMIALYCRGHHGGTSLCPDCAVLESYSHRRSENCPRQAAEKGFCSGCPHPCYQPQQWEAIRAVMRYAGPRLLLRHPGPVISHLWTRMRNRKKTEATE